MELVQRQPPCLILLVLALLTSCRAATCPCHVEPRLRFDLAAAHLLLESGASTDARNVRWTSLNDGPPDATAVKLGISASGMGMPPDPAVVNTTHVLTVGTEAGDVRIVLTVERRDAASATIGRSYFEATGPGLSGLEFCAQMRGRADRDPEGETMTANLAIRKVDSEEIYLLTAHFTERGEVISDGSDED